MKYREIRKTKRYRTERAADGVALTRSAFQLLFGFILLLFIGAVIFGLIFPTVIFSKRADNRLQHYSVVTVRDDRFQRGDIVSLKTENHITAGEILALEGDRIVIGTDRTKSVNCVQYNGTRYFSYEELNKALQEPIVPKGYVLLDGDFTSSEELSVGEIVPCSYITGKVRFILYPFSLFGRPAEYLKK